MSFVEQEAVLTKMLSSGEKATQRNVKKERDKDRPLVPSRRLLSKLADARRSQKHVEDSFIVGVQYAMGLVKPERVPGLNALLREIQSEKKNQKRAKV